jgi:hypothetical protein
MAREAVDLLTLSRPKNMAAALDMRRVYMY